MSFYDDASLVFLPSGQAGKDGKAYSMKPTNGDGDFTFSRGSNLTATRIDSNGLIEKGRENLLLQSNQFDTTWLNVGTNETSGQSGYDGTNNAWLLDTTFDGTNRRIYQSVSLNSVQTFSFYAKAGTSEWCYVNIIQSATNANNYYHLSGVGSKGASPSVSIINETIESVGNGWYRISITGDLDTSEVRIQIANGDGDSSAVVGDNIYIQDAQLEQGLVATEYIESGATTGKAGLLEDSPRFDYSGGASCPSLLLEPSRTNLVEYSEYFEDTSWWFQTNADVELSDNTSPEGLKNAYKVTYGAGGNRLGGANFGLPNTPHTNSIYMRKVSGSGVVNFTNQLGDTNNITLTTDWERYDVTATLVDGTARLYIYLSTLGDVIEVWGAQQEEGSYPTSYIPNHSGGSVTREAEDIAINTLDQTYSTDITIFLEVERLVSTSDLNKEISVTINSTTSPNNRFTFYSTSNGRFRILITDDSGNTDNLYSATNAFEKGETIKVALKITSSGCTLFVDGSSVDTSSGIGRILGIDRISFFKDSIIKQYLMFPTALSDNNCITLTS